MATKISVLELVDAFGKKHPLNGLGFAQEGVELGAVKKMTNLRLLNASLAKSLGQMNKKAAGRLRPMILPLQKTLQANARQIAAQLRAKRGFIAALRPNWVSPVNFDGIGATSLSGIATQASPHQGWWLLLGFACSIGDPASTVPEMRLVSMKIRSLERLMDASAQLTWSAGAPTSPGVPFSMLDQRRQQGSDVLGAQHSWYPWGTNAGGTWLEESVTINVQAYNPHAAAQSRTLLIYGRSSPCGQGDEEKRILSMSQAMGLLRVNKGEFGKLRSAFKQVGGQDIYDAAGLGYMENDSDSYED